MWRPGRVSSSPGQGPRRLGWVLGGMWKGGRQVKISSLLMQGIGLVIFAGSPEACVGQTHLMLSPAQSNVLGRLLSVMVPGLVLQKKAFRICCYQDSWPYFCGASLSLLSGWATLEASPASGRCLWLRMNNRQPSKVSRMSWEPRRRASRRSRGKRCWRARRAAGSNRPDSSIRSSSGSSGAGMAGSVTLQAIQILRLPFLLPPHLAKTWGGQDAPHHTFHLHHHAPQTSIHVSLLLP